MVFQFSEMEQLGFRLCPELNGNSALISSFGLAEEQSKSLAAQKDANLSLCICDTGFRFL